MLLGDDPPGNLSCELKNRNVGKSPSRTVVRESRRDTALTRQVAPFRWLCSRHSSWQCRIHPHVLHAQAPRHFTKTPIHFSMSLSV